MTTVVDRAILVGGDLAGLRHAAVTLLQLLSLCNAVGSQDVVRQTCDRGLHACLYDAILSLRVKYFNTNMHACM